MIANKGADEEPLLKKLKVDHSSCNSDEYMNDEALEKLLFDLDRDKSGSFTRYDKDTNDGICSNGDNINDEIEKLLSLDQIEMGTNDDSVHERSKPNGNTSKTTQFTDSPSNSSPFDSPVETVTTNTSVCDDENKHTSMIPAEPKINKNTISSIKKSMMDTSKFISTFTTLKTTYLKLCKEFNYLLSKFNENEKIKIELINENNELKNLLMEIITEREMEKRKARSSIDSLSHNSVSMKRKLADI